MTSRVDAGIAQERLLCLSAFTGIGGLDLGLERAGFSIIGAVENDPAARRSLSLNRPRVPYLRPHDIDEVARTYLPRDLGIEESELALLAAGPPCQPFSKAAQWSPTGARGLVDARAGCLRGLMVLVERFLPHALLIENVPGFATGKSSAMPFLVQRLAEVNIRNNTRYKLSSCTFDAAELGVPQRRRRAIVIALRSGDDAEWPSVKHSDHPVRAWDALEDVRPKTAPALSGRFAGLLPSIPEGRNYQYFTERGEGPSLFGYRRRFWSFLLKLAKAEPAWTVPANPGPATGPFHWENRPLAPEEILRLQTFPSSWRLEGSYREQVRQAGNATPPLLAELLGRSLVGQLVGAIFPKHPTLAIARCPYVPPPSDPRPVPREYMSLIGQHAPHPGAGNGPRPRPSLGPQGQEDDVESTSADGIKIEQGLEKPNHESPGHDFDFAQVVGPSAKHMT